MISKKIYLYVPILISFLFLSIGYSGETDAPKRFDLTGKVIYKGKPVPYGEIIFIPDNSKGNKGPGTAVNIKDGKYETLAEKGVIGGAHLVQITGFDAPPISGAVPAEGEIEPKLLLKNM